MARPGRPLTGTAKSAGHLDGLVDGANGRSCDPRGRWVKLHPMRPESDWVEYRDAYVSAYVSAYTGAARSQR